jgi:hypothetical protein
MSDEFTPITTQEEFNTRIADRIKRVEAKYADYDELKAKADGVDAAVEAARVEEQSKYEAELAKFSDYDDLKKKVGEYETKDTVAKLKADVAKTTGVPAELLSGSTQEELEAHAAVLKPFLKTGPVVPNPGDTPANTPESEERQFVREIFSGD